MLAVRRRQHNAVQLGIIQQRLKVIAQINALGGAIIDSAFFAPGHAGCEGDLIRNALHRINQDLTPFTATGDAAFYHVLFPKHYIVGIDGPRCLTHGEYMMHEERRALRRRYQIFFIRQRHG